MSNERKKYPRTFHLDFSKALQSDDKLIDSLDAFHGQEIQVSLKMDGENTTLYHDNYLHARSIDSKTNWTRNFAKSIHSNLVATQSIPENFRLCCENVFAKHSIYYPDGYLEGYLYLLSVWNDKNKCLSVKETDEYAELLDLPRPKELYRGVFDYDKLKELSKNLDTSIEEGFVVRLTREFSYDEFSKCVTKFVRAGHVQDNAEHWLRNAVQNGALKQPSKPAFLSNSYTPENEDLNKSKKKKFKP